MLLLRKRASTRMKKKKFTNLDFLYIIYIIKLNVLKNLLSLFSYGFLLVIVFAIWFVLSFSMPCLVIIIYLLLSFYFIFKNENFSNLVYIIRIIFIY